MRRSFLGLTTPRFQYDTMIGKLPAPVDIATPERATFLIEEETGQLNHILIKKGAHVKTGQKLALTDPAGAYAISSVTGTVASIEPFPGESGRRYTAVSIDVSSVESFDDGFEALCDHPTREAAERYLSFLPGDLSFKALSDPDKPIHTLVINAVDRDLLVVTARYAIAACLDDLKKGIGILKSITGIDNIVLAAPRDTLQGYGEIGASAISVESSYPYGLPYFIARNIVGHEFPVNQNFHELGLCFLSVEAVVSLGRSFARKKIAATKLITFIDKSGNRSLITAKIGTPIGDIFKAFHLTINDQDRIIIGGPMTGYTVFSESYPVQPGTDAIMVQDKNDIAFVSDYPCINCGECIRVCPARIQVNLLIRFLEAGQFEDAAENYDLFSCLDCGLCSFVCVSRIPIFQYITLAKYELGKMNAGETTDE
jgi:electron transport complex protein RnfC